MSTREASSELQREATPLDRSIVGLKPTSASTDLSVSLRGQDLFELRSETTLRRLHDACVSLQPSATVHLLDGTTVEARLVIDADGLALSADEPIDSGLHQVRTLLFGVVFVVYVHTEAAELHLRYRIERARWFTFDRRQVSRLATHSSDVDMLWFDPTGEGLEARHARVVDLTPEGLSVLAPYLPDEGLFPAAVCLDEQMIQCTVETCRRHPAQEGLHRYGLRLQTDPSDDRLRRAYIARRFPRLFPRFEFERSALSELFSRSGYLDLRAGEGVSEAWRSFSAGSSASFDMVFKAKDGEPLGHLSVTRTYARTWLLHQLATLGQHEESVVCRTTLYDLCSSIPVLLDGDAAHALAYFDVNKRWHQLFFHEFVRWIDTPAEASIALFDRFERKPDAPEAVVRDGSFLIEPARHSDLPAATSLARSQLPAVLANALDMNPWSLRSENLARSADPIARQRAREVLVLREEGMIRAVAFCETGQKAASIFNILNMAQIFVRRGAQSPSREAQVALLSAVRSYYAARAVVDPLIIAPKGTFEALADPATFLAETMGAIAMSARALRQWENFCRVHFGVQALASKAA